MVDERSLGLVAVIEDDPSERRALGRLLDAAGFCAHLFDSAETFIGAHTQLTWVGLIVDVQMTGMSGIDLQHWLRREGSPTPVIIVTGDRAESIRTRAQQQGCAAFLHKPVCGTAILDALAEIVRPSRS